MDTVKSADGTVIAYDRAGAGRALIVSLAYAVGGHVLGFSTSSVRYATKRKFWGHDRIIGLLSTLCSAGAELRFIGGVLDVVRFTDELLDRLGRDADMSKLPTG
jgi:hypothetical protein